MSKQKVSAVVPYRFNRTAFHSFFTKLLFVLIFWLLVDIGVPSIIISGKVCRSCLSTKIAVDTLIVHVEFPRDILSVFIFNVSHSYLAFNVVDPFVACAQRDPEHYDVRNLA